MKELPSKESREPERDPRKIAAPLLHVARLHEDRGEYSDAERLYQGAVKALEQGGESIAITRLTVWSLAGLANLYRVLGRYHEAEPRFDMRSRWPSGSLGSMI